MKSNSEKISFFEIKYYTIRTYKLKLLEWNIQNDRIESFLFFDLYYVKHKCILICILYKFKTVDDGMVVLTNKTRFLKDKINYW